jgi:hypothetical protein
MIMDALIQETYNALNPEAFDSCRTLTPGSNSCSSCFHGQFFNGNAISYDCEEKRKLYLLRYFTVHAAENYHAARQIPDEIVDAWFEKGEISILSLGGGPGSDLFGVLRFIEEEYQRRQYQNPFTVSIIRLDIEEQWDSILDDVVSRFFGWLDDYQKIQLDVNDDFESLPRQEFDLITASYLVSELTSDGRMVLADNIGSVLVDDGVLIINDRPESAVEDDIRGMMRRLSAKCCAWRFTGWAGYCYPNDIADEVHPKFNMNSSAFVGVKS